MLFLKTYYSVEIVFVEVEQAVVDGYGALLGAGVGVDVGRGLYGKAEDGLR